MIKFPKIRITKCSLVAFTHKYTKGVYNFGYSYLSIEEAQSKAVQDFTILDLNMNDYTMSTKREINISITF